MSSDSHYPRNPAPQALVLKEQGIEETFIEKLSGLKYTYRPDIGDRAALERNFREKFESLNRVRLTDGEFQRLLDELITPDVFTAARVIRERNDFTRDDGTPLTYTLVNIKDWCKNDFEVVHQLRINTDYIMALLVKFSNETPSKQTMNREQLIGLIQADAKFMDERDAITDYVRTLQAGQGLDEKEIRAGYQRFKAERNGAELAAVAQKHGLPIDRLETFVDAILQRMVFDGEQLTSLMEPLGLGWRERRVKELALMDDLVPLLKKRAAGRDISGLSAYEQ